MEEKKGGVNCFTRGTMKQARSKKLHFSTQACPGSGDVSLVKKRESPQDEKRPWKFAKIFRLSSLNLLGKDGIGEKKALRGDFGR